LCAAISGLFTLLFWVVVIGVIVLFVLWLVGVSSGQVKQENIVEVWSTLLPGQVEKRGKFYHFIQKGLETVPDLNVARGH